jgi:hypothetical protein
MLEVWQPIIGFEDYEVSTLGNIRSLRTFYRSEPIQLKQTVSKQRGYPVVRLSYAGFIKTIPVHRLVAEAFNDNPDNKPEVNHKDGNKLNNKADNLEWSTYSENLQHAYNTGLRLNKVIQRSMSGEFIKEFSNCAEAERYTGFRRQSIARCARKERLSYAGYLWEYI